MDICLSVKPNLVVKRARFSALVASELHRAMQTLVAPNKNDADAVECRSIMDLRSGAAFTRFQTLLLQNTFDWKAGGCIQRDKAGNELDLMLISYGSCQYPTLGLIVQRQWCASIDCRLKLHYNVALCVLIPRLCLHIATTASLFVGWSNGCGGICLNTACH